MAMKFVVFIFHSCDLGIDGTIYRMMNFKLCLLILDRSIRTEVTVTSRGSFTGVPGPPEILYNCV